jgi:DNA-binding response OmpR family regulator
VKSLVIEDDAKTSQAIRRGLGAEGYEASVAGTGEEGSFEVNSDAFDLVALN